MILFFRTPSKSVIATEIDHKPSQDEINELCWLYGDALGIFDAHDKLFLCGVWSCGNGSIWRLPLAENK
jgi:hypothetical protein